MIGLREDTGSAPAAISHAPAFTAKIFAAGGWLEEEALVVLELGSDEALSVPIGFEPIDERQYGAAKILVLQFGTPDSAA